MSYAYQATVTVPAPSSGTLTNFTLVLTGTDTKLKTVANGGQIQNTVTRTYGSYSQTVPADLILSSDSGGTSLYNWGFDYYDPIGGTALIWVQVPSYSAGLTIYVSIGNAAVSTYQGGSIGSEFDTNTKAVYHFGNGSTLVTSDFSANGNNLTNSSTVATTGKIGGGVNSFGYLTGSISSISTAATFGCWIKVTSNGNYQVCISPNATGPELFAVNRTSGFVAYLGAGSGINDTTTTITDGNWHKLDCVFDGSTTVNLYIDGVVKGTFSQSSQTINTFTIGDVAGYTVYPVNGSMDEVRFVATNRSANWIATEYANQSSPPVMSTFSALGPTFSKALADVFTLIEALKCGVAITKTEIFTLVSAIKQAVGVKLTEVLTLTETIERQIIVKWTELFTLIEVVNFPRLLTFADVFSLTDLLSTFTNYLNLQYFRNYMLDLKSVRVAVSYPQPQSTVTVDPNIVYFRQYLGRI